MTAWPNFSTRINKPELMDDLALGGDTMRQTLDQLAVVNRYLGGGQAWRGLQQVLRQADRSRTYVLADLGCGGGESLRQMARWARQAGYSLELWGFDANPHVVAYAREKSTAYPEIRYAVADIFSPEFQQRQFDLMTCSLFLHHFSEEELRSLLPRLADMAPQGLIISDLQRHWLPWVLFGLVTKLLGASHMIRYDGMLSIRRAFTRRDLQDLLQPLQRPLTIQWRWAFRYLAVIQ